MATRWGIVGAGRISHDFILALNLLPPEEHKVAAVAARDLKRAQSMCEHFNIEKAYGTYEELADDPDIDIAYIGVMNVAHFDVCKLMISRGKNVLCEKPVTLNSRRCKEIIALAKEKGVFFMEAIWSRFFPAYEVLRKELTSGSIGDIKAVTAEMGKPSHKPLPLKEDEGAVMDLGCYVFQFATLIFDAMPEKIVATGIKPSGGGDILDSITLIYSGDRVAQLLINKTFYLTNNAIVYGTTGKIELSDFWHPETITTPSKTYDFPLPQAAEPVNYKGTEGLMYEAQAVRNYLLQGVKESPLMSHRHSEMNMTILDEVRRQLGIIFEVDKP